jgi:hypothetical protein
MIKLLGTGECDNVCPFKFEGMGSNQKYLTKEKLKNGEKI